MTKIAIIGGTGFSGFDNISNLKEQAIETPYAKEPVILTVGEIASRSVIFIARHGKGHSIAPHKINYRANLWALKSYGVEQIIAIAAVGGISKKMSPKTIVIPNQIIDYTYGREHTFFDENFKPEQHIDFTYPYTKPLREKLLSATDKLSTTIIDGGVYAATQGPRLETAAEINKLEKDGCDIVGMTGMPEAALARELEIDYACCAVIANWGAGKSNSEITMQEIETNLVEGMQNVKELLGKVLLG